MLIVLELSFQNKIFRCKIIYSNNMVQMVVSSSKNLVRFLKQNRYNNNYM